MVSALNKDMTWDPFFKWTEAALQSHDIDALPEVAPPLMDAISNIVPYTGPATSYSIRVAKQPADNEQTYETSLDYYMITLTLPQTSDAEAVCIRNKIINRLNEETDPFKRAQKCVMCAGFSFCPLDFCAELGRKIQAIEPAIKNKRRALQASAWAAMCMIEGTEQKTQAIENFKYKVSQLKTAQERVEAYEDVANNWQSEGEMRHVCILGIYQELQHLTSPLDRIPALRAVTQHVADDKTYPIQNAPRELADEIKKLPCPEWRIKENLETIEKCASFGSPSEIFQHAVLCDILNYKEPELRIPLFEDYLRGYGFDNPVDEQIAVNAWLSDVKASLPEEKLFARLLDVVSTSPIQPRTHGKESYLEEQASLALVGLIEAKPRSERLALYSQTLETALPNSVLKETLLNILTEEYIDAPDMDVDLLGRMASDTPKEDVMFPIRFEAFKKKVAGLDSREDRINALSKTAKSSNLALRSASAESLKDLLETTPNRADASLYRKDGTAPSKTPQQGS